MTGLLDERRGRKGPTKLTAEVSNFINELGPCSATEAAVALEEAMGVRLSPRSIQRAGNDEAVLAGRPSLLRPTTSACAPPSCPAGHSLTELACGPLLAQGPGRAYRLAGGRASFAAVVAGANRPAWTPYGDPGLEALAATYRLLLAEAGPGHGTALTASPWGRP